MGHHDVSETLDGSLTMKGVRDRVDQLRDDPDSDWSHVASGVKFETHQSFSSYNEAWEYLARKVESYEPAIAVEYKEADREALNTPKYLKLTERIKKAKFELDQLNIKLKNQLLAGKSPFIKCRSCNSKLARAHVKDTDCKVCHEDMLSPTSLARIAKGQAKLDGLVQERTELAKELNQKKGKTKWLVMGSFHS